MATGYLIILIIDFAIQEGLHTIAPYTYMTVDGFLTSSTSKGLSFHSWSKHRHGIVLGRQITKPNGRNGRLRDGSTCRAIGNIPRLVGPHKYLMGRYCLNVVHAS